MFSNAIQHRTIFATMLTAALLAACTPPERTTTPVKAVIGTVDLAERIKLPPQAVLIVELQDTCHTDAATKMVSQQAIKIENFQPPFKFWLPVDSNHINPEEQYVVSARIMDGNKPIFTSNSACPVLTLGAGRRINIMLMRATQ